MTLMDKILQQSLLYGPEAVRPGLVFVSSRATTTGIGCVSVLAPPSPKWQLQPVKYLPFQDH